MPKGNYQRHVDHSGKRFGRLLIDSKVGFESGRNKGSIWKCICDCGAVQLYFSRALIQVKECESCAIATRANRKPIRGDWDFKFSDHNILKITRLLAKGAQTREDLHKNLKINEDQLYDCLTVMFDEKRIRTFHSGRGRVYCLR